MTREEAAHWIGARSQPGYGVMGIGSTKIYLAHRLSYEHYVGIIPDGRNLTSLSSHRMRKRVHEAMVT